MASAYQQRKSRIARSDRQLAIAENRGLRALRGMASANIQAILDGWDKGGLDRIIAGMRESVVRETAVAATEAHYRAMIDAIVEKDQHDEPRLSLGIFPVNVERLLKDRLGVGEADIEAIAARYGEYAANFLGGQHDRELQRKVYELMARGTREGKLRPALERELRGLLDTMGMTPKNPYYYENIVRTVSQIGNSAGARAIDRDPVIDEILWGYEYVTVGDNRVRPNHAALDGFRAPKGDPVWKRIMPSNGWGCRCRVLRIFNDEVDFLPPLPPGVDVGAGVPEPDPGWDWSPGDLQVAINTGISGVRRLSLGNVEKCSCVGCRG